MYMAKQRNNFLISTIRSKQLTFDLSIPCFSYATRSLWLKTITTSHSYGASQNSTLRNFVLPGPIVTKLGAVDYVGDPYSVANFS